MTQRSVETECLAMEITKISDLSRGSLVERWANAYGRPPPKGISRRLLEYTAAYQLQLDRIGRLKPATRRKLSRLAESTSDNRVSPKRAGSKTELGPGSRLIREWHGKTHIVDVRENGVLYQGQTYRSLSEVARLITGARWSGPRFFGL